MWEIVAPSGEKMDRVGADGGPGGQQDGQQEIGIGSYLQCW